MSQHSEQVTEAKKSSHEDSESNSELETESEEGSMASEDDTFLSIQFPSPPNYPTPYLCNQDFQSSEQAMKFIMKHFNLGTIHDGFQRYPDLSKDPAHYNTFINPDHFNTLQ